MYTKETECKEEVERVFAGAPKEMAGEEARASRSSHAVTLGRPPDFSTVELPSFVRFHSPLLCSAQSYMYHDNPRNRFVKPEKTELHCLVVMTQHVIRTLGESITEQPKAVPSLQTSKLRPVGERGWSRPVFFAVSATLWTGLFNQRQLLSPSLLRIWMSL